MAKESAQGAPEEEQSHISQGEHNKPLTAAEVLFQSMRLSANNIGVKVTNRCNPEEIIINKPGWEIRIYFTPKNILDEKEDIALLEFWREMGVFTLRKGKDIDTNVDTVTLTYSAECVDEEIPPDAMDVIKKYKFESSAPDEIIRGVATIRKKIAGNGHLGEEESQQDADRTLDYRVEEDQFNAETYENFKFSSIVIDVAPEEVPQEKIEEIMIILEVIAEEEELIFKSSEDGRSVSLSTHADVNYIKKMEPDRVEFFERLSEIQGVSIILL